MPEKTPNSEGNSVSDQDLEALAAEVLAKPSDGSLVGEIVDAEIVPDAEVVAKAQPDVVDAEAVVPSERSYLDMPPRAHAVAAGPVDSKQRELQTKGGAVAGVLLGTLSIVGAFLTGYSLINAFIGLVLSAWGLQSSDHKLATAGILLSIVGAILSIAFGITQ